MVGTPSSDWDTIFESLLRLYQKLKELGFTYYEGKVTIIDISEEDSDA